MLRLSPFWLRILICTEHKAQGTHTLTLPAWTCEHIRVDRFAHLSCRCWHCICQCLTELLVSCCFMEMDVCAMFGNLVVVCSTCFCPSISNSFLFQHTCVTTTPSSSTHHWKDRAWSDTALLCMYRFLPLRSLLFHSRSVAILHSARTLSVSVDSGVLHASVWDSVCNWTGSLEREEYWEYQQCLKPSWKTCQAAPPGFEPGTFCLPGRCANHYAMV